MLIWTDLQINVQRIRHSQVMLARKAATSSIRFNFISLITASIPENKYKRVKSNLE